MHWLHILLISISLMPIAMKSTHAQEVSALDLSKPVIPSSFATIEQAEYRVTFADGTLTDGSFLWKILQKGNAGGALEIGTANLNFTDLVSDVSDVNWGTTQKGRKLVLIENQISQVRGKWSLPGQTFPGQTIFECRFPPAMLSTLYVSLPLTHTIHSSFGLVTPIDSPEPQRYRLWKVELGRLSSTKLTVSLRNLPRQKILPSIQVDTVHVTRQDGVFTQTNFILEGLSSERRKQLRVQIPATVEIQSISSSGVPVPFQDSVDQFRMVSLELPETESTTRINLRIQTFKPARWVRQQKLPVIKLVEGIEAKRTISLRVENPFELHNVQHKGLFQTGLSKEIRGEVWKFESYMDNPELIVELGQPQFQLRTEIHSLNHFDTPLPWSSTKVTATVKSGQLFLLTLSVPDDWQVVSLIALDSDSHISSWTTDEQSKLQIYFKKPLTLDSPKSIEILSKTKLAFSLKEIPLPSLISTKSSLTSIQSDWIIPGKYDIDLNAGARWNRLTSGVDVSKFKLVPEKAVDSPQQTRRSFF